MKFNPLKLGLAGVAVYVVAVTWVFLQSGIASGEAPPSWRIVDRPMPDGPKLLGLLGVALVLASVVWAAVRRRRISQ